MYFNILWKYHLLRVKATWIFNGPSLLGTSHLVNTFLQVQCPLCLWKRFYIYIHIYQSNLGVHQRVPVRLYSFSTGICVAAQPHHQIKPGASFFLTWIRQLTSVSIGKHCTFRQQAYNYRMWDCQAGNHDLFAPAQTGQTLVFTGYRSCSHVCGTIISHCNTTIIIFMHSSYTQILRILNLTMIYLHLHKRGRLWCLPLMFACLRNNHFAL
jgi:hypothetical protein